MQMLKRHPTYDIMKSFKAVFLIKYERILNQLCKSAGLFHHRIVKDVLKTAVPRMIVGVGLRDTLHLLSNNWKYIK